MSDTAICTWFVADDATTASFFPQIGSLSNAPAAQIAYWRTTVCFFASSIALNVDARHVFFTNTVLPTIDGVSLAELFSSWKVEVIRLPITYRLPKEASTAWGNQFYIFDILDYISLNPVAGRTIVLDSDCLWVNPVAQMEESIDAHGALTYLLDHTAYGEHASINGLSRQGMARFVAGNGGRTYPSVPYFGGEIYAATQGMTRRISRRARELWPAVLAQVSDAPREEAHLLSILYELEGVESGTANRFIRRMWTTFQHHDLKPADRHLTVWHLPAEKKTGFADLFAAIIKHPHLHPHRDAAAMRLDLPNYARVMGWPRRRPAKFVRDLVFKLKEKARA